MRRIYSFWPLRSTQGQIARTLSIAAQLSNIVSFGKVYQADAADGTASVIETSESGDVCELWLPTAIRDQLYALLEAERMGRR